MKDLARVLAVALLLSELLSAQTREISSDEADRHLVKSVQAAYPEMAQIAHILGDVTLRVTISKTGDVTDVQSVSGHPLLIQAAEKAVRQWHYTPFEFAGRRTAVVTTVAITFPKGLPLTPKESEKRKELNQLLGDLTACTFMVETKKFEKAEPFCRRAAAFSKTLDPPQPLLRMEACKYMGHLLSFQGKTEEALQNYQEELLIALKAGESYPAALAEAYANVGNIKRDLDDQKGAVEHYEKAERIYRQINKDPASEAEKTVYAYAFWRVLRSHAEILRQMGQPADAAVLEHEAAGIVVDEGGPR